jgi:endonuclease YncB( thermonuclease family)
MDGRAVKLQWQAAGPARGFRAYLTRSHDGDSFWLMCDAAGDLRWEPELRLTGVRAPELRQPGGIETRDFVNAWFAGHTAASIRRWPFWVETLLTSAYEPEMKTTFRRYLATVWPYDQRRVEDSLNYQVNTYLSGHPEWPPGE